MAFRNLNDSAIFLPMLRCSTCPLIFGCWESRGFSQTEKERTAGEPEQIHNMTPIFTQNSPELSF